MTGAEFGIDWGTLVAVYLALFLFGLGFNRLVDWLERNGYSEGFVSLLVVAGVGITVVMTAVISPAFALVTAGAFIFSGTPMIVGSVARHAIERKRRIQTLVNEIRNGNETESLAAER